MKTSDSFITIGMGFRQNDYCGLKAHTNIFVQFCVAEYQSYQVLKYNLILL